VQSGGFETAGRWIGRQWAYVMKSLGQNRKSFGSGRPAKDEADLSSVRGAHAARQAVALARPQAARGSAVSVHRLPGMSTWLSGPRPRVKRRRETPAEHGLQYGQDWPFRYFSNEISLMGRMTYPPRAS